MVPFQKITEACKNTGLSQYYLRQGCKNGTIPHIKSGGVYYINVPALMDELEKKKSSCCFANKLRKIFIQSAKKKRRLKGF